MNPKAAQKKIPLRQQKIDHGFFLICLFSFMLAEALFYGISNAFAWEVCVGSCIKVFFGLMALTLIDLGLRERWEKGMENSRFSGLTLLSFISLALSVAVFLITRLVEKTSQPASSVFTIGFLLGVLGYLFLADRISRNGWAEFFYAFTASVFVPGIAYADQKGAAPSELGSLFFTLFLLVFAHFVIRTMKDYGVHGKKPARSFLEVVGWQTGTRIHHAFMILAYILMLVSCLVYGAWRSYGLVFLSLPISIGLIVYSCRIEQGAKPNWRLLNTLSISTVLVAIYPLILVNITRTI